MQFTVRPCRLRWEFQWLNGEPMPPQKSLTAPTYCRVGQRLNQWICQWFFQDPQGETLLWGFKLWSSLPEWEGWCGGGLFGIQGPAVTMNAPPSGSKATMLGRVVNSTWSQRLVVGGWEPGGHQVPVLATSLALFDRVSVQDSSATAIIGHISHFCDVLTALLHKQC